MNAERQRGHRIRLWLYALLSLAIMTAIFLLSAQPGEESAELSSDFLSGPIGAFLSRFLPRLSDRGLDFDIRKYAHMFEYFCLGVGVCLFFSEALEKRWPAFFSAVAFCFLYACSDELHQSFVPGRAALFSDVLIDGAGYLLGPALTALLYPRRKSDPGV